MPGCVTIPPEAPSKSSELGKRISALKNANVRLLNRYFDQKRMEVDRFIQDVWQPEFAKKFSKGLLFFLYSQLSLPMPEPDA